MSKNLHHKRENYTKSTLEDKNIYLNPLLLFDKWYDMAEKHPNIKEANIMIVSTTSNNIPRSRVLLLKEYSAKGFVFYTNYKSKKGIDIEVNNKVCLLFFWHNLEKQIIIHGIAKKLPVKQSEDYFNSRPRGSKISAIISKQSNVILNREVLDKKAEELKNLPEEELSKPKHWGGYIIEPETIEFWQGRESRLHDRIEYFKDKEDQWQWQRLSP